MDEPKLPVALAEAEHRGGELDPARAGLVGAEPISNVIMMEDHDGAYYAWKQAGLHGRVLLHIDAHIDFGWIPERDPEELLSLRTLRELEDLSSTDFLWNFTRRPTDKLIDEGNYLNPALREGILRSVYWVAPDGFFATRGRRKQLEAMLHKMRKSNPRALRQIAWTDGVLRAALYGKPLTICPLSEIPRVDEDVLLDIDTDFLITESMSPAYPYPDLPKTTPWIWPEELVARLKDNGVRTDFVTIAYSVEGGYTPLSHKYLGDELALRLKHPALPEYFCELLAHKRRGARFRSCNELNHAITEFEQAVGLAPEDASTHYNLAHLYDEKRAYDQAVAHYRQAVQLDPTYATAYNNFGSLYQSLGKLDRARDEYLRILRWDSRHADAQYGLAETLTQQKRWDEAITCYQTVMALRPDHAGAYRGLGYVYAKHGRWEEAVQQLNRAIALQSDDGLGHRWLAEARFHQRRWDEALGAYREALRCGFRSVTVYRRLGSLYLRNRQFHKAFIHYRRALRLRGRLAKARLTRTWRTLQEKCSSARQVCSR